MIEKLIEETENIDDLVAFLNVYMTIDNEENPISICNQEVYDDIEEEIVSSKKLEEMKKIQVHQILKEGIEKHVNELCIDTCQDLWKKNIYTKEIKVDENKIEIILDKLNEENVSIFGKRAEKNENKYILNENNEYTIQVQRTNKTDGAIKSELKNSIKYFFIQDIETGFLDKKKFLMNVCDCEKVEGMKENSENLNIKIVFDESKMEKTFEEYLKEKNYEHLYLKEEDRVYLDEYYLNAHKNYLKAKEM